MNPIKEIEQAIAIMTAAKNAPQFMPDKYECSDEEFSAACERIVTLGRTIDAQVSILEEGLNSARFHERILDKLDGTASNPFRHALIIARAINGTRA